MDHIPRKVRELIEKFDNELRDPSISDRRRLFLEGRKEIHLELHGIFARLAGTNEQPEE